MSLEAGQGGTHWIYDRYDPRITYVCNNPHYRIIRYDWHNAHFISCLSCHFYDDRDILLRVSRARYVAPNRVC